jgi:hypothetical protein
LWQIFAESANDYDQCSDEHAFLLLLHFTLREWDTAVMIIVVFDAMIMSYLSMLCVSSLFFMPNEAMLIS